METEDLIKLPASSSSGNESETEGVHDSGGEPLKIDSQTVNSEVKEDGEIGRMPENISNDEIEANQCCLASEFEEDMDISPPHLEVRVELTETISVTEKLSCLRSEAENGFAAVKEGSNLSNYKEDKPYTSRQEINATGLSGAKRPRMSVDEQQPSVHVIYSSLTRESRKKLEELLQQWSQWDARHCPSSNDSNVVLESGEETYFPALHVGLNKASAVSFWMDNQTKNLPSKEFIPLDGNSIPLYDRGFSLALTSTNGSSDLERRVEVRQASRCFNCGSYNHALSKCPKPRDNVAVNNARKQHKTRRNPNANSRNPTRYYQNSPKGKFDGLRPGALDAETRQLLGLGELDPPPWLNRMREIGYPPGYLDPEDEDQPSGITIFGDEEIDKETEEGEILDAGCPEPPRKMSVEFPGINAPLPENADGRRWEAGSSSFNMSRSPYGRYDHSKESISRGHYYEQMSYRDYQDDAPLGCDLRSSSHRYGGYDSNYHSPGGNSSGRRTPNYWRSMSDKTRRSPLRHDNHSDHGP